MTQEDFKLFWPTFKEIVTAQETYAFDPDISYEEAYSLWCVAPQKTFTCKDGETLLGSYFLRANASGPSAHISNCGYMVCQDARGKGVARKMCEHSQDIARLLGYKAMQFNSVISTNKIAIELWKKLGFNIIGTIPNAYKHKRLGYVDSFIMHKMLSEAENATT